MSGQESARPSRRKELRGAIYFLVFFGLCWGVKEFDWFHDIRAWLDHPAPTWLLLVIGWCVWTCVRTTEGILRATVSREIAEIRAGIESANEALERMEERQVFGQRVSSAGK